jgi:hypothetical protein
MLRESPSDLPELPAPPSQPKQLGSPVHIKQEPGELPSSPTVPTSAPAPRKRERDGAFPSHNVPSSMLEASLQGEAHKPFAPSPLVNVVDGGSSDSTRKRAKHAMGDAEEDTHSARTAAGF